MTDQDDLFPGIPDAPKPAEPPNALPGATGALIERTRAAMQERQRREATEAEEAARLAELDAAAAAMAPAEQEAAEPENREGEAPSHVDNVIPLRRAKRPEKAGEAAEKPHRGGGNFFSIDHHVWGSVCGLGIRPALAYLVMASGTRGDTQITKWGAHSIETYAGIGEKRATDAIAALVNAGLVKRLPKASPTELQRYYLASASEMTPAEPVALSAAEAATLRDFQRSPLGRAMAVPKRAAPERRWGAGPRSVDWSCTTPYTAAQGLAAKGYLEEMGGNYFRLRPAQPVAASAPPEPDLVWLPNEIVTGGRPSPLTRIRQSGSLPALRILIDFYHAHDLTDGSGVSWRGETGIRVNYARHQIGQHGPYTVWGFKNPLPGTWPAGPGVAPYLVAGKEAELFWDGLDVLQSLGLIAPVPHLVDSTTDPEAEIIHPLPYPLDENPAAQAEEVALGVAAIRAAQTMVTEGQAIWAERNNYRIIAPVFSHVKDVGLIGIFRLTFRPNTTKTRLWFARLGHLSEWAERYKAMQEKASGQKAPGTKTGTSMGVKGR